MKEENNNLEPNDNEKKEPIKAKNSKIKRIVIVLLVLPIAVMLIKVFAGIVDYVYDEIRYKTQPQGVTVKKPIIYLYPTEETNVEVKVGKPENLTHTYPKYETGWEVTAKPNGDLVDLKTGRNLYALYWEGINEVKPNMKEGFIVKGEDTIPFLEEKLAILGLNEREAEEFIVYWLPKLEENKYNFIRFQTKEEINKNMPLEITPAPDTIIRIVMEFKGIEKEIEVQEQKLKSPERKGFTVVEWGGTEIN